MNTMESLKKVKNQVKGNRNMKVVIAMMENGTKDSEKVTENIYSKMKMYLKVIGKKG